MQLNGVKILTNISVKFILIFTSHLRLDLLIVEKFKVKVIRNYFSGYSYIFWTNQRRNDKKRVFV